MEPIDDGVAPRVGLFDVLGSLVGLIEGLFRFAASLSLSRLMVSSIVSSNSIRACRLFLRIANSAAFAPLPAFSSILPARRLGFPALLGVGDLGEIRPAVDGAPDVVACCACAAAAWALRRLLSRNFLVLRGDSCCCVVDRVSSSEVRRRWGGVRRVSSAGEASSLLVSCGDLCFCCCFRWFCIGLLVRVLVLFLSPGSLSPPPRDGDRLLGVDFLLRGKVFALSVGVSW